MSFTLRSFKRVYEELHSCKEEEEERGVRSVSTVHPVNTEDVGDNKYSLATKTQTEMGDGHNVAIFPGYSYKQGEERAW